VRVLFVFDFFILPFSVLEETGKRIATVVQRRSRSTKLNPIKKENAT